MSDLKTTFAGLKLKNPVIISSSGLTNSAQKNKRLEESGAGAIVLKSLFEEQITLEANQMHDSIYYPEGGDYLMAALRQHKLSDYLYLIKESKAICKIPIIASINCYTDSEWIKFAKEIEQAGADALEINILSLQTEVQYEWGAFEMKHIQILSHLKKQINIPIIMKLGNNLTNPIALINQLYANGAAAVVLFNRLYQPDIDIDKVAQTAGPVFSHNSDLGNSLRWIGIASAQIPQIDYAASGGVHTPKDVVKALLAGASAVEICTSIYQNGAESIKPMLTFMSTWMNDKGYERISQFKGKLNVKDVKGTNTFERTQFLKYYGTKE
ncbi:dihydroorotate dehydrogenase-like protein [Bacteroides sp. 214]|uniref:dihydroorotate dehydrogenase-like protein n=1 Tax=Bacteroides sp. 214 TaxID=2302935 RepID=UPI0013CFAF90|nr:dihydroorotate dehydrogenase-like protein [Bacteroides sp. 214]NDW11372.1 dihydroorotate dehydrogenase-like protein [Bacteroides sp. 214]